MTKKPLNPNHDHSDTNDDDVIVPGGGSVSGLALKSVNFGVGVLWAEVTATAPAALSSSVLKVLCLDGYKTPATLQDVLNTTNNYLSVENQQKPTFSEKNISFAGKKKGNPFTVHAAVIWSNGSSEYLGSDSIQT